MAKKKASSLKDLNVRDNKIEITEHRIPDFEIERKFKLTTKQCNLLEKILDEESVCCMIEGMAGTGKTAVAVYGALQLLKNGKIEEIIYVRSPTQIKDAALGFMPGGESEKMDPYNHVFFEKLAEFISEYDYSALFKAKALKTMPTSFIRGYNLRNAVVIVDECQNMSFDTLYTLITRIAEGSKIIFIADSSQIDIAKDKSGSSRLYNIFNDEDSRNNGINYFEFKDIQDIKRSALVRFVIQKVQEASRYV